LAARRKSEPSLLPLPPPTAGEIEEDLRRQFAALGIEPIHQRHLPDLVYDLLVEIARETKKPVAPTDVAARIQISDSTASRACQRLVREGRAYPIKISAHGNRYIPRVV